MRHARVYVVIAPQMLWVHRRPCLTQNERSTMTSVTDTNTPAKRNLPAMIGLTALPLAVGGLASLLTSTAMVQFKAFAQPPLSPPAWLFPVAWTGLYLLMGLGSYRLYRHAPANTTETKARRMALAIYGIQLAINFSWSLVFFGVGAHWMAFGLLMTMWAMIIALVVLSSKLDRIAAWLFVPYLVWTTFAAYLNVMIAILN